MSIENTKQFLSARDNSGFWNKPSSLPTPTGLSLWPLSFESPSCRRTQPGLLMAHGHHYGWPLCRGAGVSLWDGWKWKWKLPSHVWLCDPGILQARVLEWVACMAPTYQLSHKGSPRTLEWVACPFSRGSSQPRNGTCVSCIAGGFFTSWATCDSLFETF